jgi:hypothetical protein
MMQASINQSFEYKPTATSGSSIPKISISRGNSKLGKIPNISLPAGKACKRYVPCRKDCYANKGTSKFPAAQIAWERNYVLATNYRSTYFSMLTEYFKRAKPKRFRWHVSGDILDQNYLFYMIDIARDYNCTKFLAFTKMYHLNFDTVPDNLQIVFSAWPKYHIEAKNGFKIAWMQDGTETRIPKSARDCPGSCESCDMCWNLKQLGNDVVFHKH